MDLVSALVTYGKASAQNLASLRQAQAEAFESIKAGKGGQIINASGNGVSFGVSTNGLTNASWFSSLTSAIARIDRGFNNQSRVRARF
jgi:hypothetical protein